MNIRDLSWVRAQLTLLPALLLVAPGALRAQYSWHTFYPMDRGQVRGQRAVNPWIYAASPNQTHIGAQLTFRLPCCIAGDGSNRPAANFPATVSSWTVDGTTYYNAHQPEYYLNWWCGAQTPNIIYISGTQECLDLNSYQELITEIPNVNGTATVQWLGSWAAGGGSSYLSGSFYSVSYDASVCNMLVHPSQPALDQALTNPSNIRPLLFGIPQAVNSPVFGPAVCQVTFNNHTNFSQANLASDPNNPNYVPYAVAHLATTLYDDFTNATGHFLEAVNFYYAAVPQAGPNGTTILTTPPNCVATLAHMPNGSLPSGVSVTDSTNACVTGSEGYFMVDASNNLYNGFVAWQLTMGDFNDPNPNVWHTNWEFDHDWFPNGFGTDGTQHLWGSNTTFPSSQQFSFDSCSFWYLVNGDEALSCN